MDTAHNQTEIKSVAVVGARGGMGRLFVRLFEQAGLTVLPCDRPLTPDKVRESAGQADLVYLSVPYPALEEVVRRVAPAMRPGAILADNCSVKVQPMTIMQRLARGPVVGTHPLFGPRPGTGSELRTAVVQGSDKDSLEQVSLLMDVLGAGPFVTTADRHDRCVALIQGLNFVTTVSYLACATQEQDMENFLTPSFERRLQAARKMLLEDAELFATLFEANPFSQDAVRQFRGYLNLAAAGDLELLVEKSSWWWRRNDPGDGA